MYAASGMPFYIYTLNGGSVFRRALFNLFEILRWYEESSHTNSNDSQQQSSNATITKKLKMVDEDSVLSCDDYEENDRIDFFKSYVYDD
jgi:hypothetical protein